MQPDDENFRYQLEAEAIQAEVARAMVHEFNNFLNTLLLQIAMMEATAPAGLGRDITSIRQEGKKIAHLIKGWLGMRKKRADVPGPWDLNQVVADVVHKSGDASFSPGNILLELTPGPVPVQAALVDLRILCSLLIRAGLCAAATDDAAPGVVVRTENRAPQVAVTVVDFGPRLEPKALLEVFDPHRSVRSGLQLAACKALARRLGGRLQAENDDTNGLAISFVTNGAQV